MKHSQLALICSVAVAPPSIYLQGAWLALAFIFLIGEWYVNKKAAKDKP